MGGASLAQVPKRAQAKLQKIVKGLDMVVEAGWVTSQQRKTVSAFLQQKAQAAEDDEDMQTPAAYESSSDGILGAIEGMQEKAETSLASERKQEMKDQQGFELLKMA